MSEEPAAKAKKNGSFRARMRKHHIEAARECLHAYAEIWEEENNRMRGDRSICKLHTICIAVAGASLLMGDPYLVIASGIIWFIHTGDFMFNRMIEEHTFQKMQSMSSLAVSASFSEMSTKDLDEKTLRRISQELRDKYPNGWQETSTLIGRQVEAIKMRQAKRQQENQEN